MRLVFILFFAIFAVACVHLPEYSYTEHRANTISQKVITVRIDKNFSYGDKIAIDDALNSWNYALNNLLVFKLISSDFDMEPSEISDAGLLIMKIDHNSYFAPSSKDGDVLGFTVVDSHPEMIYIVRDRIYSEEMLSNIIRHEVGHSLGAKDIRQTGYLMSLDYSNEWEQCIDKNAIEQISRYQNLDINKLNYCEYDK